jgi:hypothetical protein
MVELISIKKSDKPEKKYVAEFSDNGRISHTYFGAAGMIDYTKDSKLTRNDRKNRYLARHHKNENWNDPTSAGALSRYILWNKSTVSASIADYKRRFGL